MQGSTRVYKGLQKYVVLLTSFSTTFQVIRVRITAKTIPLKQPASGYSSSESTELVSFKKHLSVSKCIRILMVPRLATFQ